MRSNPQDALRRFLQKREVEGTPPPSIREVCQEVGFRSTNAATKLIQRMRAAGEVIYEPGQARSLRLTKRPSSGIPLLGSIAAGFPDNPDLEATECLQLDPASFGITNPRNAFALRVRGVSMVGRHFFDGDLVIFDRSAQPRNHDVVAALIDQQCSLKTLVVKNGRAWLKAENPDCPDLRPAHDLQIQGVAKAVIRILAA